MSNKEILEKAIQKAIDGGWTGYWYGALKTEDTMPSATELYQLIFNHDFAKALWRWGGKAKMYYSFPLHWGMYQADDINPTSAELEEWQFHLQQIVIADDPIKYLGENI